MAVSFSIPKSPAKSVMTIDEFLGVDFTNSPANIDENKSPDARNMIRDVPGKVRKRMGYEVYKVYGLNFFETDLTSSASVTVNADKSLTINGTLSDSLLKIKDSLTLKANIKYALTGIHEDTHLDIGTWGFVIYPHGTTDVPIDIIGNDGVESEGFTLEDDEIVDVYVWSETDFVFDHMTVYPMIVRYDNINRAYQKHDNLEYEALNINGYHYRRGDAHPIVHVGKYMIQNDVILYNDANNHISKSWQFGDNLYIIDGKKMLIYNDSGMKTVESVAYVPTLTIGKSPTGGGTEYEAINLMASGFTELFRGTAADVTYYMTFGSLDSKAVEAWTLNAQGNWTRLYEGTHFSVNRSVGSITFTTAPGVSPLTGEDNVKITAYRTVSGYADRINKCTIGTRFGVNGAFDRLFLSGNPGYINSDWYSQQWDATYFPDTGYSLLGSSKSAVVGYSIISNYLATHKDELEQDLSIILREGDMIEDEPSFKIINTLQGAGAIAPYSFSYLCTEPLFLTRSGLYAVTAQDITGEKYAQSRSFYLNGRLTAEPFEVLQDSFSIIFNDMYLLSVGEDRLYILDGLQPIRTDRSEPYATRQYVAYYCDNLPIHSMWEFENRLYFGTSDGKMCLFHNDKDSLLSFNDDGQAIECQWETPDIDGKLFYKNKSVRYLALRVGSAIATSVSIWTMVRGLWNMVKEDNSFARYLSFHSLVFSKVAFGGDKTQKVSRTKLRIKKVDKFRLRFVNDKHNEPFALYNVALEFIENGNFKG